MKNYKKVVASSSGDILYIPHKYLGHTLSKNSRSFFSRKYSKEEYFTNNEGWRVGSKNQKAKEVDILFAGDSNALGTGVEYKNTIGYFLSKILKKKIANIGIGSYSDIQILRKINLNAQIAKPKVVIYLYTNTIARCFKQNGLLDIVHRPILKKNKKNKNIELVEPNQIPFFIYKRFAKLELKKRNNKFNIFNKIEREFLWTLCQIINRRLKNFVKRILNISKNEYIDSNDRFARLHAIKLISKEINRLVYKFNFKVLFFPIYPYLKKRKEINKHYNEMKVFVEILKKSKNNKNIFFEVSKNLENLNKSFFKKRKKKNFLGVLHWIDNNHPTPLGTKLIAKSIASSLTKYRLI